MKSFYELEEYALVKDVPIMQKEGIEYLIDELNKRNAESVLEIGSAIGYSSLMMVTHVKGLHVDTIERDDTRYQEAVVNIKDFHQEDNITIYHEDALEFDDTLLNHAPYDCLFIDAAKAQYQRFFEKYVPYLKEDGFVLVDNLDFHGMIFEYLFQDLDVQMTCLLKNYTNVVGVEVYKKKMYFSFPYML